MTQEQKEFMKHWIPILAQMSIDALVEKEVSVHINPRFSVELNDAWITIYLFNKDGKLMGSSWMISAPDWSLSKEESYGMAEEILAEIKEAISKE